MKSKSKYLFFALLFVVFFLSISYIFSEEKKNTTKEENKQKSRLEEWKETLLYGIDSEILTVLDKIKETKERSLDKLLLQTLKETTNTDIRKALIEIFANEKNLDAYDEILKILKNYDEELDDTILASLDYIKRVAKEVKESKTIRSAELEDALKDIIDYGNSAIASSAVRALGMVGKDKGTLSEYLLKKLDDAEVPESVKNSIVLALGDLKSKSAVEKLIKIVKDQDANRVLRMYACEALGKIGDKKAIPAIRKIFREKDALLRAYAASSLAMFAINKDTLRVLMDGLKDSNWRVRVQSAKALAKAKSPDAIPILRYKVLNDPVKQVKVESLKALGAIGSKKAHKIVVGVFKDKKLSYMLRGEALKVLAKEGLDKNMSIIKEVLNECNPKYEARFIQTIAQVLAGTKSTKDKKILEGLLDSKDPVIRIYAIRGIALNRFKDLRGRLEAIAEDDPVNSVKREARTALDKLK